VITEIKINTNSLTDRLEVDLLRSMIVIVTVVFCVLSFLADENSYLSNEIALWIYFITISPLVFLFTLSIKNHSKLTLGILLLALTSCGVLYSIYNFSRFVETNGYKSFLLLAHAATILYFFYNASKTLGKENAVIDYKYAKDNPNKSSARKLTIRRNRREHSRAKNSTKIKSGQYRG